MNGLLDTSVLIDLVPAELPDDVSISVVSTAELRLGVLLARDAASRAARLARVTEVERLFDPLPVDEDVAGAYADIVASARERGKRPRAMDALIAATALAHGLMLYTRDRDFQDLPRVQVKLLPRT
ncbi:MAG: PIN domain-containing protein [Candidatus Limnocylindria bacterium]